MITSHTPETFPDHIKHVRDTIDARNFLKTNFGVSKVDKILGLYNYAYIVIDLNEKSWRPTMDYMWLYRNTPPLITVVEAVNLLNQ